ncbi:hypothetical protein GTP91_33760, partial [Rugamonas sp. FT82W]|nr:hypothetical protein [Duganella vulcania]
ASFGILRYLDPDPAVRAMLAAGGGAEVAFNYFGQVGAAGGAALSVLEGYAGRVRSPEDRGACPLELNILARGRQFEAHWTYDPGRIDAAQLERLADGFEVALGVLTQALAQRDRPLLEAGALAAGALEPQLLRAAMEELDL